MIVIAWERPDGGITVECPAYDANVRRIEDSLIETGDTREDMDLALRESLVAKTQARLQLKYAGPAIPHFVDDLDLPVDQSLFNAWVWLGDRVQVDMVKASDLGLII